MLRLAFLLWLLATPAFASDNQFPTPGNALAPGAVQMCMNGSNQAVPCTAQNSMPVTIVGPDGPEGGVSVSINPFREDPANHSSSFTVGGAWQSVAAADPLRQRLFIQNYCSAATQGIAASESIFLALGDTMPTQSPLAAAGPIELVTCGNYDTSMAVVSTGQLWLWAASAGHRFVVLEW